MMWIGSASGYWEETAARVDFSEYSFDRRADFLGYIFPSDTSFRRALFFEWGVL